MNKAKEIREVIRRICGKDAGGFLFFNADVKSVEDDSCTVTYSDVDIPDVRLNAAINGSTNNIIVKPTIGSTVLIADLSEGDLRDLAIIGWSEVDSITINGGELGGLTNTIELKTQLEKLTKRVDDIISAISGAPAATPTDGGAAAQTYTKGKLDLIIDKEDFKDIEDQKIKH